MNTPKLKIKATLVTLLAVGLIGLAGASYAQPGFDRMAEELNLTDQQRAALAELRAEQREEVQALAEQRREQNATQREAHLAAMEQRQAAQRERMAEILTPEQMTRFDEMRAEARERRMERMEHDGEMRSGGPGPRGEGRPMNGPRGN